MKYRWKCGALLGVLAAWGCQQTRNARTLEQFNFVQPDMRISDVTNRLGKPDRLSGQEMVILEYALGDGSQILILSDAKPPAWNCSGAVQALVRKQGTNWSWLRGRR